MQRISLALLLGLSSAGVAATPQWATPAALQIEDADTLLAEVDGVSYRIQLPDIDAPENTPNPKLQRDVERTGLGQERLLVLGREADAGLRRLLDGSGPLRLSFDPEARDRYGRVPGDLHDAQGSTLSLRLVEAGYAVPLAAVTGERAAQLAAAHERARAGRHGLWGADSEAFSAWAGPPPQSR